MSQAKILWLSDIHYLHNEDFIDKIYKKKINQYFESIRDEIYNKIKPTHIVITGDIVFSAKKEQYDGLYDHILKSYLLDNPKVRLLTCIGNHSVNRDMVKIFTEKVRQGKTNFWKSENRQNFISTSKDDDILNKFLNYQEVKNQLANYSINDLVKEKNLFNLLFIHYIAFYKERVISRIDDINRLNPEEIQILNQDRNECKFGVIHDTKYNLIFVTLNSAYLAWGDETYEELYKDSSKAFQNLDN
ncbi:MAG: metallophosphoesterase [Saprospiraceae bacterium]|nr:metallophosphoesterase [Saprospiraceae bacterium]